MNNQTVIYKYALMDRPRLAHPGFFYEVSTTLFSQVLDIQFQKEGLVLWAQIAANASRTPQKEKVYYAVFTGMEFPLIGLSYVCTRTDHEGLVFHIYEFNPKPVE